MKSQLKRYVLYAVCAAIIMLAAYGILTKPDMQIRIIYALGQQIETEEYLLFDQGDGYEERNKTVAGISLEETAGRRMFDTFFKIQDANSEVTGMQFQLQPRVGAEDARIQIRTIEIINHHITTQKYAPKDIKEIFEFENVQGIKIEDDRLCIEVQEDKYAVLEAKDAFVQAYRESTTIPKEMIWNLLLAGVLFAGLAILIDSICIKRLRKKEREQISENRGKLQTALGIVMIIAFACVALMAFMSKFYAHPDEDVTRLAIDYYMTHWMPPNIQDVSVLGTFSNYGVTRLTEPTLYYLAAGKIGWIFATFFHVSKYYRMLNLILFGIMIFMLLKKKDNLWMFIGIGITPQLWYLFSYATSDAWDFFWSFLVIYELLEPNSALNKFLTKRSVHPIWNVLQVSFIFSMLFRGKQNYYLILLFAFIVLVIRWWRIKEDKAAIAAKYIIIAAGSGLLLLPHIGIKQYVDTQFNKNAIYAENQPITELRKADEGEYAQKEMTPEESYTPTATTVVTTRRAQGYSFLDIAIKDVKDIISGLTNSGVGSYGWLEYYHSYWYGFAITGLYGLAALYIAYYMIRNRRLAGMIDTGIMIGMVVLAYIMVAYTCWTSDYQTQGRYVLLLSLIIGYYSMQEEDIQKSKKMRILLLALGMISLSSYIGKGIFNLI